MFSKTIGASIPTNCEVGPGTNPSSDVLVDNRVFPNQLIDWESFRTSDNNFLRYSLSQILEPKMKASNFLNKDIGKSVNSLLQGLLTVLSIHSENRMLKKFRKNNSTIFKEQGTTHATTDISSSKFRFDYEKETSHMYSLVDQVISSTREILDFSSYWKYAKDLVNEPMNQFQDYPEPSKIKFTGKFGKFFKSRTHKGARKKSNLTLWSNWSMTKRACEALPKTMIYEQFKKHVHSMTSEDVLCQTELEELMNGIKPILDDLIANTSSSFCDLIDQFSSIHKLYDQPISTSACLENNSSRGGASTLLQAVMYLKFFNIEPSYFDLLINKIKTHTDIEVGTLLDYLESEGRDNFNNLCQSEEYNRSDYNPFNLNNDKKYKGHVSWFDTNGILHDKDHKNNGRLGNFSSSNTWSHNPSNTIPSNDPRDHTGLTVENYLHYIEEDTEQKSKIDSVSEAFGLEDPDEIDQFIQNRVRTLILSIPELKSIKECHGTELVKKKPFYGLQHNYFSSMISPLREFQPIVEAEINSFGTDRGSLRTVVHGLLEPLKVRVITKGAALPYWLTKGFQLLLHKGLKKLTPFRLIGEEINTKHLEEMASYYTLNSYYAYEPHRLSWFSGDYQSSTDALSTSLSKSIMSYLFLGYKNSFLNKNIDRKNNNSHNMDLINNYHRLCESSTFNQVIKYKELPYTGTLDVGIDGVTPTGVEEEEEGADEGLIKEEDPELVAESDRINEEQFQAWERLKKDSEEHCKEVAKTGLNPNFKILAKGAAFCLTQNNGQLMGSLLSFPLLCLVNMTLYLAATKFTRPRPNHGEKDTYSDVIINGDDILYIGVTYTKDEPDYENCDNWSRHSSIGERLGLKMSPGKSFRSRTFAQINSCNFYCPIGNLDLKRVWTKNKCSQPLRPNADIYVNDKGEDCFFGLPSNYRSLVLSSIDRIPSFPVGLFWGKQKSMGRVTGSSSQEEAEILRRRPMTSVIDKIFDNLPIPDFKIKSYWLVHYHYNRKSIDLEKKNRNLFLPRSLGGLGQKPIEGFSYDITPLQYLTGIVGLQLILGGLDSNVKLVERSKNESGVPIGREIKESTDLLSMIHTGSSYNKFDTDYNRNERLNLINTYKVCYQSLACFPKLQDNLELEMLRERDIKDPKYKNFVKKYHPNSLKIFSYGFSLFRKFFNTIGINEDLLSHVELQDACQPYHLGLKSENKFNKSDQQMVTSFLDVTCMFEGLNEDQQEGWSGYFKDYMAGGSKSLWVPEQGLETDSCQSYQPLQLSNIFEWVDRMSLRNQDSPFTIEECHTNSLNFNKNAFKEQQENDFRETLREDREDPEACPSEEEAGSN